MQGYIPLTKEGFAKFNQEFQDITEKRKEAVINITRAREMGDLSENGFYKAARHELSSIDRRLRELGYILKNAHILRPNPSRTVGLGNTIEVLANGKKMEYQIVGKYEADPKKGKLSNESPVGKVLLGRQVGEKVFFKITETSAKYEIINIK